MGFNKGEVACNIVLQNYQNKMVMALAQKRGMTKSKLIREAVLKYILESEEGDNERVRLLEKELVKYKQ